MFERNLTKTMKIPRSCLLLKIHVFVMLMLMFLVLMVCLAGIVAAVFHSTLLSMKLFVVLWCPGVYLLFWSLWVYVVMMVRGQMACL